MMMIAVGTNYYDSLNIPEMVMRLSKYFVTQQFIL